MRFQFKKRECVAAGLFNLFVAPTFAADRYVLVISADFNLIALFYEISGSIDTCIYDCLSTAIACRFNLVNRISDLEQSSASFEKVALEICSKTIADDIASEIIDNAGKLIDLTL